MTSIKYVIMAAVLFFLMCNPVAASVKISPLPQPSPTAKLRVFVVVITTESKLTKRPVLWLVSPTELQESMTGEINKMLKDQGIYEVVSAGDVYAVLGSQAISNGEWAAKDMALLKNVGKALHADYALLFERSFKVHLQFDVHLVNLNTGEKFSVSNYIPLSTLKPLHSDARKKAGMEAIKISYRQLFSDAKSNLLQTAIGKGRTAAEKPHQPFPHDVENKNDLSRKQVSTKPARENTEPPAMESVKTGSRQVAFEKELDMALSAKNRTIIFPRLVVYDFEATDHLKVAGLILTEALREELHKSGGFILVNRENILKIIDEYKLQQSGAVDETQAVKMGKWLAANEAVTGSLAVLGSTSILQVKRINIQTLGTIALGSLKCPTGREDELLDQMPGLAHELTKPK